MYAAKYPITPSKGAAPLSGSIIILSKYYPNFLENKIVKKGAHAPFCYPLFLDIKLIYFRGNENRTLIWKSKNKIKNK